MILKIHPSGSWPSNLGTSSLICGRGKGEEGGENFGEVGGGKASWASRSRMKSILESIVICAWARDAWFCERDCWL